MTWQVALFLLSCIVALIGVIHAALQWEVRKLRRQGHTHATRLAVLSLAISMIANKVGVEYRGWKDDDE